MSSSFHSVLQSVKLSSLPAPKSKEVIIISSKETPVQGFEKLINNQILSAPVIDEATNKYVGFLDIRDLVSYTVYAFNNRNVVDSYSSSGPIYHTLLDNVTVTYLARRNPFHAVSKDQTLLEVAQELKKGVHRVPIIDEHGKVISIVSQSTIIATLNKFLDSTLKDETNVKLCDIKIGSSPVFHVSTSTPTIDTFKIMDDSKISGLPIINQEGHLIGNISGRDLKLFIESSSYDLLKLPIFEFLKEIRKESIDIRAPSISCCLDETLSILIKKLAATGVHRIYVVKSSKEYVPVGVVSLTDILKFILSKD